MFCQPYGGSTAYTYFSPGVVHEFAAFVDPCWNRILYATNDYSEIRAVGSTGSGSNQYRAPRSIEVFSPDDYDAVGSFYNIFVCDNGNNRVQHLKYFRSEPENGIISVRYISGALLPSPVDFDYDNRGDYSLVSDDYLWVVNANNTISRVSVVDGTISLTYGSTGGGNGQFDSITTIACGHDPYTRANDNTIFVTDAGNNRIVKLQYLGNTISWIKELYYYHTPFVVDIESDTYGHLWTITDAGLVSKFSPDLDVLDEIAMGGQQTNNLFKPTCLSNAGGWLGSGGMMFSEEWSENTGIKGFTIGTDIKDLSVGRFTSDHRCMATISLRITDISAVRLRIYKPDGTLVATPKDYWADNELVFAGVHNFTWNGKNLQGQDEKCYDCFVEAMAQSNYKNPQTLEFSATVFDTAAFASACDPPCTWLVGDADGNGIFTISDAVTVINYIFAGGPAPHPHPVGSGDADCNQIVTIADSVYLINFIFSGGPAPQCNCADYI